MDMSLLRKGRSFQIQFLSTPVVDSTSDVHLLFAAYYRPPVAHLPGHKKPSIAVRFSPVYYKLRIGPSKTTENFTIDTSSDGTIPALPPPVVDTDPTSSDEGKDGGTESGTNASTVLFSLPYRMVYAIATQDSVLIYDTQQHTPLCAISNLHYATFTDLTWFI
jgi:chromatin assembly factor 1 subunit B